MAVLNKIWTFNSDLDGWSSLLERGTITWSNGEVLGGVSGRSVIGTFVLSISGTYEGFGVPANSVISSAYLKVTHRCSIYNTVTTLGFDATINGIVSINTVSYSSTSSNVISSGNAVSLNAVASDIVQLAFNGSARTGRSTKAIAELAWDNIELVIEYVAPLRVSITSATALSSADIISPTSVTGSAVIGVNTMTVTLNTDNHIVKGSSLFVPTVTPTATSEMKLPQTVKGEVEVLSTTQQASGEAKTPLVSSISNIKIQDESRTVFADAIDPTASIAYPTTIEVPTMGANVEMQTPVRHSIKKLMTLDSLKRLVLLGEIIEGSKVDLNKYGTLTVTEIVEGNEFSLSPTGVLTVNTFREEGI